ncbi:MAG: GspH/FimT family pseudopilin [Gallionella sp.]|nr:GspH/FimT family pseudopilin [Gallionella sp.]
MLARLQRGMSLVEVLVSIAIVAIIVSIGIPNLTTWMQDTQIKSTAESILTGLQLARAEAVRQNAKARFQLTGTTGMASWKVTTQRLDRTDCNAGADLFPCDVQNGQAKEGGANARVGVSTAAPGTVAYTTAIASGTGMSGSPSVVFDAFGRADSKSTNITRIDVTNAVATNARRMVITISDSGMAKLCDPSLPAANPRGCS